MPRDADCNRQDFASANCNATLSLTLLPVVCLYTDAEELGWRLSSTFHHQIQASAASTVKVTSLCVHVCVSRWGSSISQSVGGQLIGFFFHLTWPYECVYVGFCVCATIRGYVLTSYRDVLFFLCECVCLFVCKFGFVHVCQTVDNGGSYFGDKYCRGVKLHAGKVEWRAGAVWCFSFLLDPSFSALHRSFSNFVSTSTSFLHVTLLVSNQQ